MITHAAYPAQTAPGRVSKSFCRKVVLRALGRFRIGQLHLHLPEGGSQVVGEPRGGGPVAHLRVRNEAFFRRCALHGGVGLGEAYMAGDWETEDLRAVISLLILNIAREHDLEGSSQRVRGVGWLRGFDRVLHRLRPNSLTMSRRNIAEHYDLGNDFYELWLDRTMTYSSALFLSPDDSLEQAQSAKVEALCQKLRLSPSDHVLEIGCGWGGFACHAAALHGCRVTGITLSQAQYDHAVERVRREGLEGRVEIRLCDYRTVEGGYDKIVSIEMIEAVGARYLPVFLKKCDELLLPSGLLGLQMITVPDQRYNRLRKGADFIQRHIFPGSLLLSVGRIGRILERRTQLGLHELHDMGSSYARTLREWDENFEKAIPEVQRMGFSEEFIRKWRFYLKYCEAAFATRNISVVQAIYTRPNNPLLHREDGTSPGGW